ncbi:hypothetical protein ACSBR1_030136 [Camellia fascicularis]
MNSEQIAIISHKVQWPVVCGDLKLSSEDLQEFTASTKCQITQEPMHGRQDAFWAESLLASGSWTLIGAAEHSKHIYIYNVHIFGMLSRGMFRILVGLTFILLRFNLFI